MKFDRLIQEMSNAVFGVVPETRVYRSPVHNKLVNVWANLRQQLESNIMTKDYVVRSAARPEVQWDFDHYEEARQFRDKHPSRLRLDLRIYKLQLVEIPDSLGDAAVHAADLFRNREG